MIPGSQRAHTQWETRDPAARGRWVEELEGKQLRPVYKYLDHRSGRGRQRPQALSGWRLCLQQAEQGRSWWRWEDRAGLSAGMGREGDN
jgi:hypothetical protein